MTFQRCIYSPQWLQSAEGLMLEKGGALHLAMEILKLEGWSYGHQQPWVIEGLRLDNEDAWGVLTANMFDSRNYKVETEQGLGWKWDENSKVNEQHKLKMDKDEKWNKVGREQNEETKWTVKLWNMLANWTLKK